MDTRSLTCISVCSGVGGLDLGLHAAAGMEPVVYIEREAHSAAVLVARMEEQAIPSAPIWDDVCTFDARPWRGLVDCVAGGTPCQDLSLAGKRTGLDGERSRLFYEHVRIARECESPFFFWENVAGAVGVIPLVAEHLHANGYTAVVWTVVRASDVGAPHRRERVFLLAFSAGFGREQRGPEPAGEQGRPDASEFRRAVANSDVTGLQGRLVRRGGRPNERALGPLSGALGAFPPARDDTAGWAGVLAGRPDLAPALPRLRGLDDGVGAGLDVCVCPRQDRLRAAGNGVVPQQAALAWHILWDALTRR